MMLLKLIKLASLEATQVQNNNGVTGVKCRATNVAKKMKTKDDTFWKMTKMTMAMAMAIVVNVTFAAVVER